MRIKPGRETIVFNGIEFYRYPKAKNWAERSYFRPKITDVARGIEALHREIWKAHYGPIPNGCDIHHKDGNPLNNDISNLECLTIAEHRARHKTHKIKPTLSALALAMAAKWHRSAQGREWHRQHGHDSWKNRKPVVHICEICGSEFDAPDARPTTRFCSDKCRAQARRNAHKDFESRICAYCRNTFSCNRYEPTKYCGNSCAKRSADERRRYAS